mmetsp:Transcript_82537/g.238978  ORF Transcript_82537/g.238978 Transcript_82537/m.238978 type:complete len:176 (-) Transcript_82537:28-555(-)
MLEPEARPEREVAESAMLFLHMEMARSLWELNGLDAATAQLDAIGFQTGTRFVARQSVLKFPFTTLLNAMKFLCKDVWPVLFRKSVDRLQVDKLGNYVIQDRSFRWLEPLSGGGRDVEVQEAAALHVALPVGVIRGALHALGVDCTVAADISAAALPMCHFKVTPLKSDEGKETA